MNACTMLGRLTRDPEIRYAKNEEQTPVASFSIAVNRPTRRGEEKKADFFRCVSFGWLAEFAEEHLYKGMRVCVTGRLQNESYENKEGETVRYDQIILREIHFADGKLSDENPEETIGKSMSAGGKGGQSEKGRDRQKERNSGSSTKSGRQESRYQSRGRKQAVDESFMNEGMEEELPFN